MKKKSLLAELNHNYSVRKSKKIPMSKRLSDHVIPMEVQSDQVLALFNVLTNEIERLEVLVGGEATRVVHVPLTISDIREEKEKRADDGLSEPFPLYEHLKCPF